MDDDEELETRLAAAKVVRDLSDAALLKALNENGIRTAQIAKALGVSHSTLSRVVQGTSTLSRPNRERLEGFYEEKLVEVRQTAVVVEEQTRSHVAVEVLPSYAGMGGGGTGEGEVERVLVARQLIEDELRGRADNFLLVDCRGDSMSPIFLHGDQILVDKRDLDPVQPGPFALWDGDGYVVKLVERIAGRRGWYRIFSANDTYSSYEAAAEEIRIMGRPVWFSRRM